MSKIVAAGLSAGRTGVFDAQLRLRTREATEMIVKTILANKGSNVVTIEPTATLADASKLLAKHGIGAVVVTGAGQRIVGIVSERDIVRALAEHGDKALSLPLTEFMTRKVVTCTCAETIAGLMERMTGGKFRHIPVVEDGRMV